MVAGCNISAKEDTGTGKEAGVVFCVSGQFVRTDCPGRFCAMVCAVMKKGIRNSLSRELRMPDNSVIRYVTSDSLRNNA